MDDECSGNSIVPVPVYVHTTKEEVGVVNIDYVTRIGNYSHKPKK